MIDVTVQAIHLTPISDKHLTGAQVVSGSGSKEKYMVWQTSPTHLLLI